MIKKMNKFGLVKTKLVNKLTESYKDNNKNDLKQIMKLLKENKSFKELYVLYEDIEEKYIDNIEVAKYYVDELSNRLNGKIKDVSSVCKNINESLGDFTFESNNLYENIDALMESDSLLNIERKVLAKQSLIKHITTKKNVIEESSTFTSNQQLLHAVLTNNFNVLYSNTLNEEEQTELKEILSLSDNDVDEKMKTLKESITSKISELINESNEDVVLSDKLTQVKNEMVSMDTSKYNYYKLKQLKNGLN